MEKFFQTCSKIDEIEIIDLLLHRYGNLEYIMQSDIEHALRIIEKAAEKEKENRYFLQWVVQLPNMTKENFKRKKIKFVNHDVVHQLICCITNTI